jgi:hypothetical protein
MNERIRLLEQAAQTAELEFGVIHDTFRIRCAEGWTPWNPLDCDSDAFRLAVQLGISLELDAHIQTDVHVFQGSAYGEYTQGVEAWWVSKTGKIINSCQSYNSDKFAAVRYAIVETASQMWETKE